MAVMTFEGTNGHLIYVKEQEELEECLAELKERLPAAPEEIPDWKKSGDEGPGTTDLCPLFNKVDEMLRRKEVISMKGLIVLCSQPGIFPYKMPPYHAAFVFATDDYSIPEVPPWGIRMVMQSDEL